MNANDLHVLAVLKADKHVTEEEYEKAKKVYFDSLAQTVSEEILDMAPIILLLTRKDIFWPI